MLLSMSADFLAGGITEATFKANMKLISKTFIEEKE